VILHTIEGKRTYSREATLIRSLGVNFRYIKEKITYSREATLIRALECDFRYIKEKITYSREATLIRALVSSMGHTSCCIVVHGSNNLSLSSYGRVSSTIIFLQQPWNTREHLKLFTFIKIFDKRKQ